VAFFAEYPLKRFFLAVRKLVVGVNFEFTSAFAASAALNPEVVQDDAFTDIGNRRHMEWGDSFGNSCAKVGNPMGFRVVAGSFEFEARYECCHGIDVVANDAGATARRFDEASTSSDKRIESNRPLKRDLAKVHIPKLIRFLGSQGQSGQDGAELGP
jgi:hypothetical protein